MLTQRRWELTATRVYLPPLAKLLGHSVSSGVDGEEPYRGEVPGSFLGLGNIIPAHSHMQVVKQGLQLCQGKAVILSIAVHEIFQEGSGAEGWQASRQGMSLGGSSPYTKQHQQEAAREGWV